MVKRNKIPEKLRPFYPPGEEEAAGTDAVASPEPEAAEAASAVSNRPSTAPKSPFRQASRLTLESLENPFRNSQPAPTHWAVGWADLMMTMFILFLVIYLFPLAKEAQSLQTAPRYQAGEAQQSGSADRQGAGVESPMGQGRGGQGQAGQAEGGQGSAELLNPGVGATEAHSEPNILKTEKLYDLTKLTREDKEFARFADIDLSPDRTVRIVLAADLLFPSGKADLRLIAKENIKKISELLQETPHMINVVGHTDDQAIRGGAFATNWELSVMRATTVARFLIDEMAVSASRITVSGQSFYRPQINNDTPANRAKNRRVEIIVSLDPPPTLPLANSKILSKPGDKR
jgi:chemotaxis protein MotB